MIYLNSFENKNKFICSIILGWVKNNHINKKKTKEKQQQREKVSSKINK